MRITLSSEDYAAAFRILSANDRHHLNLAELVENRVAPCLPAVPSLLDVGAGSGKVALSRERSAPPGQVHGA
jgi:ubiquinone/menaquinone biosynthesis C-methylase UbiE